MDGFAPQAAQLEGKTKSMRPLSISRSSHLFEGKCSQELNIWRSGAFLRLLAKT
jgi:hypothetical protein